MSLALNPGGFARLPNVFINQLKSLGPCTIAVYVALTGHCDEDRLAWPSCDRLAELTGYTRAWVTKALAELRRLGMIVRRGRKFRVVLYYVPLLGSVSPTTQDHVSSTAHKQYPLNKTQKTDHSWQDSTRPNLTMLTYREAQ